jgi:hypothetical protein
MIPPIGVLLLSLAPSDLDEVLTWSPVLSFHAQEAAPAAGRVQGPGEEGGYRYLQRFAEDASVVDVVWLEGRLRVQSFRSEVPDTDVYSLEPVFALGIGGTIEVGAIGSLLSIDSDFNPFDDESGIGDTDVWGKLRILRDPDLFDFSVGALVKLPTGDSDDGLGTGNTDVELFGGLKKAFGPIEASANGNLRFNGDLDLPSGTPNLDGETSIGLGLGAAFWLREYWAIACELTAESERFDGADSDIRITPQSEFRLTDFARIRLGVGFGLEDASPDIEAFATLAVVF